ncbi:MAG: metallophosphoesterase family protein [Bacteroidales bacterium]|nr:metallophosphoesterase family protein [Bacteroidales bacterium]MDY0140820.1 metallophosphoesterase family protein [Bacteroidales bacterium]
MRKIGLISDTHGHIDSECLDFLSDVDEIWHAGDIGSEQILDLLESKKPVRAVYGNIDDTNIRKRTKENLRFNCEEVDVWITHIGGYPGNYSSKIKKNPPRIFISGHSHILKIINDKKLGLLHINPGAAGNKGWHKFVTAIRFVINGDQISDLQVFEKSRKT